MRSRITFAFGILGAVMVVISLAAGSLPAAICGALAFSVAAWFGIES